MAIFFGILALLSCCLFPLSSGLQFSEYQCRPEVDKDQATLYLPFDGITDGEFLDGTLPTSRLYGTVQSSGGREGGALYLDGSTVVSIGEMRDGCFGYQGDCSEGFTMAFWLYNEGRETNENQYFISNGGQTGGSYGIYVLVATHDANTGLQVGVSTKYKSASVADPTWINGAKNNQWVHVTMAMDQEQLVLFENGVYVGSTKYVDRSPPLESTSYNHYVFGAPNNAMDPGTDNLGGKGMVDDFLFWDSFKGAAFVADLYNSYQDTSALPVCGEHHICKNGVCECANGKSGSNCDVDRQVLLRAATVTPSSDVTLYGLWTGDTVSPAITAPVAVDYVSTDVAVKHFYKSALAECSWNHVQNVRYSYYTGGVEVAYFSVRAANTDKITWFGSAYLYDTSFADLLTEDTFNYFNFEGHPLDNSHKRRFYVNNFYNGCERDTGYFVLLDTDHNQGCPWETLADLSVLPVFLYCPDITACLSDNWIQAEVMTITADMGSAFGGSCVSSCVGLSDGNYQSCLGCNVYVVCASEALTYVPCRNGTQFDGESGSCVDTSATCQDADATNQCLPDGCDPNPCKNNGECSMGTTGWVCDCSTDTSGYRGHTCEDIESYCKAHSGDNVCNDGTCVDEDNGQYSCTCDPGYTGENCETLASYCTAFADSTPCKNDGVCKDLSEGQHECGCVEGYTGEACDTPTYCKANENNEAVCINGGQCVDEEDGTSHHCVCTEGYKGDNCETETFCKANENNADVCSNGGTCVDDDDKEGHHCDCASGYMGANCDNETFCTANPDHCSNSGTCVDNEAGFVECTCNPGYLGTTCEIQDECVSADPCQNGAACSASEDGSASCACTRGWRGTTCGDVDECVTNNPCENGGDCSYEDGNTKCACSDGFLGDTCGQEDPCGSDPCQNEGTCAAVLGDDGTYSPDCTCTQHFSGERCEEGPCQRGQYIEECKTNSCVNKQDGTCEVEPEVADFEDNACANSQLDWVGLLVSLVIAFHSLQ